MHVDELVRRAAVEEGREVVTMDVDGYQHRVLRADAGDGVQGDHRGGLLGWQGVVVVGRHAVLAGSDTRLIGTEFLPRLRIL